MYIYGDLIISLFNSIIPKRMSTNRDSHGRFVPRDSQDSSTVTDKSMEVTSDTIQVPDDSDNESNVLMASFPTKRRRNELRTRSYLDVSIRGVLFPCVDRIVLRRNTEDKGTSN